MEAQGASLHGGRWALLLLLLGLATPLATAQVLSQEEAALLAVEEFNRNSSEESLYRLLQLDQQPDGVSGGSGEALPCCARPRRLASAGPHQKGDPPFQRDPASPRKPSQSCVPFPTVASCLRIDTVQGGAPHIQASGTSGGSRGKNGAIGPGV